MEIIAGIIIGLTIYVAIIEFASRLTFGALLNENIVDELLVNRIDKMQLNQYNDKIMNEYESSPFAPYVSLMPLSIFSKWQIDDSGRIPRWSKWTKILDERRKALIENSNDTEA